jgi:class III cytochrome C family protein
VKRSLKYLVLALLVFSLTALAVRVFRKPPVVRQPVAFSHKLHVGTNQMECVACHDSAERSAVAGIPSVTQCMVCHQSIRTESPEVQRLAAYAGRREEVPWLPVYFFPTESAVYFSHKQHFKAGIEWLSELRLPHLKSLRPGVAVDEGLMIEIRCGSADEVAVAKEIVGRSGGKSIRQHQP